MAEGKIFAGHKVRRLRNRLGMTQTDMAAAIDISPSYLNLIERNQRPLTVQVLLKLSQSFDVPLADLAGEDRDATQSLRQVFTDPLLAAEMPGPQEIIEVAEAAPNLARAVGRLHEAYRSAIERLSDLSSEMARGEDARPLPALPPFERVVRLLEERGPFLPPIEEQAEDLSARLKLREDPFGAIRTELSASFGVDTRVLPQAVMGEDAARFDRHSLRLFISENLPLAERAVMAARQLALLSGSDALYRLMDMLKVEDTETRRIGRLMLANRLAEAMLVPLGRLAPAYNEFGLDLQALARRFAVPGHVVAARLTVLSAKGADGLPRLSRIVADQAGVIIARDLAPGFPFPRFGALCARWPLFSPRQAGEAGRGSFETGEGARFSTLTLRDERRIGPETASQTVMLAWLDETADSPAPAGLTCRLCERAACPVRSHPPVTRPSALQDYVAGFSAFDLA